MEPNVRTVYGALLQTCQYLDLPVPIYENSTLNEKYNIFPTEKPTNQTRLSVKYVGFGNKGYLASQGVNNIPKIEHAQRQPTYASLFNQIPLVLRRIDNDLNPIERKDYRLRRIETYNGVPYVAYYLRVLDLSNTSPKLELREVQAGVITSDTYVPTIENLKPEPKVINPNQVVTTDGSYVCATAKIEIRFNSADLNELMNVFNIIYDGDFGYAWLSEMALCSGFDKSVSGDFNGVPGTYTESMATQIVSFNRASCYVPDNQEEYIITIDAAGTEPLLNFK